MYEYEKNAYPKPAPKTADSVRGFGENRNGGNE